MDYHPKISIVIDENTFSFKLFEALKLISKVWSQRKAAKMLGISHAVLNRRIKESEEKLGFKLVFTTSNGSELTENGIKLLKKYEKYTKRLKKGEKLVICGGYVSSSLIEALSLEYGLNAAVYKTSDENALYLASMDMVDILTLDDPVNAFINDLDFIPIAYDYLVLYPENNEDIKNINDLNGKIFVEIIDSPQRLAWNTLDDNKIQYKLKKNVKSPYEALKFIDENPHIHTFLSNSLIKGNAILKDDTRHILSCVICNREDKLVNDFLDFILTFKGQKIVERKGFEKVR